MKVETGMVKPSPEALKSIKKNLNHLYSPPDPEPDKLEQVIASHYGVSPEMVVAGNGLTEIINIISMVKKSSNSNAIISTPTFPFYERVSRLYGHKIKKVALHNYNHNMTDIISSIDADTRLIFIDSPHYITGRSISFHDLETLSTKISDESVVIYDNAYGDFENIETDLLQFLGKEKIVFGRTFSKSHCLLALRAGYVIANPKLARQLKEYRMPYSVNRLAQVAALESMNDRENTKRNIKLNEIAKGEVYSLLDHNRVKFVPTNGNFILIDFGELYPQIEDLLLRNSIKFRDHNKCGIKNHLQIHLVDSTVIRPFIDSLTAFFVQKG